MHISNIRLGFATNSSSSHSIIFCKKGQWKFRDEETEDGEFGWNEFCCASMEAKAHYLAQTLFHNLVGSIGEEMARSVATDWCRTPPVDGGHIDHQSLMSLPVSRKTPGYGFSEFHPIDKEFFDDLSAYYRREDLVVVGGNDNSEHVKFTTGRERHILPTDDGSGTYVCRKDGEWWVLMNRFSGAKIRLSFEDNPKPYTKASAPELVDIKITNLCTYGCKYCYQDSTPEGRHGDKDFIEQVCGELGNLGVFEVALGGGETTLHPNFAEILQEFHRHGIVPNFTTRNPNWIKNDVLRKTVLETAGRFAYSVENAMDMYRVYTNIESADLLSDDYRGNNKRLSFQLVMGCCSEEHFVEVVRAAARLGCDLTLLGFKEVGRGKSYRPWDYKNWLEVLMKIGEDEWTGNIGIDTTLAQQSKDQLKKKNVPDRLVTFREGAFSMYIDAVEKKMGPSSFCDDKEYIPFKMAGKKAGYQDELDKQIVSAFRSFGEKDATVPVSA